MFINSSNLHNNQTKGTLITPFLQMGKLRHGEVRRLACPKSQFIWEPMQIYKRHFHIKEESWQMVSVSLKNPQKEKSLQAGRVQSFQGSSKTWWKGRILGKDTLNSTDDKGTKQWQRSEGATGLQQKACGRESQGKLLWQKQSCDETVVLEFLFWSFKCAMSF